MWNKPLEMEGVSISCNIKNKSDGFSESCGVVFKGAWEVSWDSTWLIKSFDLSLYHLSSVPAKGSVPPDLADLLPKEGTMLVRNCSVFPGCCQLETQPTVPSTWNRNTKNMAGFSSLLNNGWCKEPNTWMQIWSARKVSAEGKKFWATFCFVLMSSGCQVGNKLFGINWH